MIFVLVSLIINFHNIWFLLIRFSSYGIFIQAFNLMNLLQENPAIYPLLPVYNNFLSACVQIHSVNYANDCLDLMEHRTVGKNEITYSQLLKVCKDQLVICQFSGLNHAPHSLDLHL